MFTNKVFDGAWDIQRCLDNAITLNNLIQTNIITIIIDFLIVRPSYYSFYYSHTLLSINPFAIAVLTSAIINC